MLTLNRKINAYQNVTSSQNEMFMGPYYNQQSFNQFIGYPVMMVNPNFSSTNNSAEDLTEASFPGLFGGSVNESKQNVEGIVKNNQISFNSAAVKSN